MNEELKAKLTERFEELSAMVDCDKDIKDALLKAYLAGGEYGHNIAVEKAVEFLKNYDAYRLCLEGHKADFVEQFRKAMEQ